MRDTYAQAFRTPCSGREAPADVGTRWPYVGTSMQMRGALRPHVRDEIAATQDGTAIRPTDGRERCFVSSAGDLGYERIPASVCAVIYQSQSAMRK